MGLHRDIYWLGRQWAVTGFGIQAVDQKRFGQYDVEAARIGDAEVVAALEALDWFDPEDFRAALRHVDRRPPSAPASGFGGPRAGLGGEK